MTLETLTNLNSDTLAKLKELVQINIDSRDGFNFAADKIENISVASMFRRLASERNRQAEELRSFVELNDEDAARSGSFAASFHRTWLNIREAFTADNAYAVLAEAERGEDHIKAAYENALKETAGSAVNDVLMRQFADVKAAHDAIRDMRDAHKE